MAAIQPRDLKDEDWKVLYSFGAADRFVPSSEIQKKSCLISVLKLNNLGLLNIEYTKDKTSGKVALYGLNEKGFKMLIRNPQYKSSNKDDYLFGAEKIPIEEARAIEKRTLEHMTITQPLPEMSQTEQPLQRLTLPG